MNREQKQEIADQLRDKFDRAIAAVLVGFDGLTVASVTDLRNRCREAGVEYMVVKNNVVRKALVGSPLADIEGLDGALKGPTAIAWSYEDPSSAAKIIKEFRQDDLIKEQLTVKCGILENEFVDAARVETELASLPGKDEIRSMLLAQLLAPAESLVRQLNAPGQNLAYAIDARRRQLEEG
jgi:large subunit ribosomal protein L10